MKPFQITTFDPVPGITLIEASAGTGKTHSIAEMMLRFVAEGSCKIDEVVLLTFTNAATFEMRDRIYRRLQNALDSAIETRDASRCRNLSRAIDQFDHSTIQTIHGFCQRILHEYSLECGLSAEFEIIKDAQDIERRIQYRIIRRVQQLAETHPALTTVADWLGFGNDFITKTWSNFNPSTPCDDPGENPEIFFRLDGLLEELREHWREQGSAIQECLLHPKNNPVRKTGSYRTEKLREAFGLLDHWTESGVPSVTLFQLLDQFSPASMIPNLKKQAELPAYDFFSKCGELFPAIQPVQTFLVQMIRSVAGSELHALNYDHLQLRYDDLLRILDQSLREQPGLVRQLRNRYRIGMIDEFQDTDPVQFSILNQIFLQEDENPDRSSLPVRPLILIGDPKQAIYSFRGGDIFTYRRARELANQQYFLSTNWRSNPTVNDGVNQLLHANSSPFLFPWLPYHPVETAPVNQNRRLYLDTDNSGRTDVSGVQFCELDKTVFSRQSAVFRQVALDVAEWLTKPYLLYSPGQEAPRRVEAGDIAVLVPKNSFAARIHAELSKAGIQAVISGGASVFESVEAIEWHRVICAIRNPRKFAWIKAALGTRMFGFGANEIAHLDEDSENSSRERILATFSEAHSQWVNGSLASAIDSLSQQFDWDINLSSTIDPQRALANHYHLIDLLLQKQGSIHLSPVEILDWYEQRLQSPDSKNEEELLRLERDAKSVNIVTMHKAKGLQYPIVLVPFTLDTSPSRQMEPPFVYHDDNGHTHQVFSKVDLTDEAESAHLTAIRSERLRLLYVAITRAEYHCRIYTREKPTRHDVIQHWLSSVDPGAAPFSLSRVTSEPIIRSRIHADGSGSERASLVPPQTLPVIPASRALWSFTSLVHRSSPAEIPGTDEFSVLPGSENEWPVDTASDVDIHRFDRGTHAGLFFHTLLERIQFGDASEWETTCRKTLSDYGYDETPWLGVILQQVETISHCRFSINHPTLSLAHIPESSLIRETEFNLPMTFHADRYRELVRHLASSESIILPQPEEISSSPNGYLRGVIDLWFTFEGKRYLMDWKTNWLGAGIGEYHQSAVRQAMSEHHYHLQYLLYLTALNRYWKLISPSFNYETDFEGVYYWFLRGLDDQIHHPAIFRTKPDYAIIEQLDNCFRP